MSRNIDNCATGNGVKKPKGGVDKQGDKPDQVLKLEIIKYRSNNSSLSCTTSACRR